MASATRWFFILLSGVLVAYLGPRAAFCQHVKLGAMPANNYAAFPMGPLSSYWTISIVVQKLDSYSDSGLAIKPIVKAKVRYGSIGQVKQMPYEDLWYGTSEPGLCLGARRLGKLGIPVRDYVSIRLLGAMAGKANASLTQVNASTDAIVRMLLDVQLNDDWIDAVVVPDDLFQSVKDHFRFYNIRAIGEAESISDGQPVFVFILRSESGKQVSEMVYRT